MPVQVKEVSTKGPATLIEWNDGTVHRSSVPSFLITRDENGNSFVEEPDEGVFYGEVWEELIAPIAAERFASILRENGVWTYADFRNNTPAVSSSFREACGELYRDFVEAVHSRQSVKKE